MPSASAVVVRLIPGSHSCAGGYYERAERQSEEAGNMTPRELEAHQERYSCLLCVHFRLGTEKRAAVRGCSRDYGVCRAGRPLSDHPRLFLRKGSVR